MLHTYQREESRADESFSTNRATIAPESISSLTEFQSVQANVALKFFVDLSSIVLLAFVFVFDFPQLIKNSPN